ncbi:MAG: hypothetical protein QM767_23520 [Anaeromyxobacter sp.]
MSGGTVQVTVRLFGALRRLAPGAEVVVEVAPGTPVSALRGKLFQALASPGAPAEALLESSAFADDAQVLAEDQPVGEGAARVTLALLPPVCGG